MTRKEFIIGQVLMNSISGAFQHAGVYAEGLDDVDPRRGALRQDLRERVEALGESYARTVSEEQHCINIQNLADDLTEIYRDRSLLRKDRFRIGIAQKALNLYLKYLWCLNDIPTPPHCPIDRQIINALPIPWKERSKYDWTKLDDIEIYKKLIGMCKQKTLVEGKASVGEWELDEWEP